MSTRNRFEIVKGRPPIVTSAAPSRSIVATGSAWTTVAGLGNSVAFHAHATSESGFAFVTGGHVGQFMTLAASSGTGRHDGTTFTAGTPIGENTGFPAQVALTTGNHTMTPLFDGTFLVTGGAFDAGGGVVGTRDDALLYVP